MKNRSKLLVAVALTGLIIMGVFAYFISQVILTDNTNFKEDTKYIYIRRSDDLSDVVEKLEPLLKDIDYFQLVADKKQYKVRSGKYPIEKGMNNNEIINSLRSKNTPIRLQFSYEKNVRTLAKTLSKQIALDAETILASFKDQDFLKAHQLDEQTLPSLFLPNTYEVFWNITADQLRERFLEEHQKFWNKERTKRLESIELSKVEVSTLASIVRKESAQPQEADKIAGVYMNRLEKGIPLQADPTVIFALQQQSGKPLEIKRVLDKDLKLESPYNTYQNKGLPPGPICIPEISYVKAVLHHEEHDYYYFAADPDDPGFHQFTKTLRQHNRNARKYRRWMNERKVYR